MLAIVLMDDLANLNIQCVNNEQGNSLGVYIAIYTAAVLARNMLIRPYVYKISLTSLYGLVYSAQNVYERVV